jgi:hypothetical protein
VANRTIAQQITILETRRTTLEAALTAATTGVNSFSVAGMSVAYSSPVQIREELTRTEKSLQRLYRGGRGMPVDMSQAASGGATFDDTRTIHETYTARSV